MSAARKVTTIISNSLTVLAIAIVLGMVMVSIFADNPYSGYALVLPFAVLMPIILLCGLLSLALNVGYVKQWAQVSPLMRILITTSYVSMALLAILFVVGWIMG